MAENILAQRVRKAIDSENLTEFIRENLQGENLSIRGVAGLCGVSDTAIIRGADVKPSKLRQALYSQGFSGADLSRDGFNPVATWLVIEYFAFESRAKAEYAKAIARTFGAFGVKSAFKEIKQPKAIPAHKETQLALLERVSPLIDRLGDDVSPIIKQLYEDRIRDVLAPQGQLPAAESSSRTEWTIRDRLDYREIRGCKKYESQMGRLAAKKYRAKHNKDPLKGNRVINGKQRGCTIYMASDVDLIDAAIDEYLDKKLGAA